MDMRDAHSTLPSDWNPFLDRRWADNVLLSLGRSASFWLVDTCLPMQIAAFLDRTPTLSALLLTIQSTPIAIITKIGSW